ncbi:MAG: ribbon-helix-helix domain-containing protein [Myxococcales bacterium]|nr:ribbon-helix-helix domain-containing protein [Myxococcales bacterium]
MGEPMRTISIKLPEELDRALTELAKKRRASRSALLRQALEAFTKSEATSVSEAADDLAGSLEGPKDLSSSSKHMKGYGE